MNHNYELENAFTAWLRTVKEAQLSAQHTVFEAGWMAREAEVVQLQTENKILDGQIDTLETENHQLRDALEEISRGSMENYREYAYEALKQGEK